MVNKLDDTELGKKYKQEIEKYFQKLTPQQLVSDKQNMKIHLSQQESIQMLLGTKGAKITFYEKGTMHKIKAERLKEQEKEENKKKNMTDEHISTSALFEAEPILELIPDDIEIPKNKGKRKNKNSKNNLR